MNRTLSTFILITALAGPAAAQDVRVSLAGKDDQTIRADIHRAAQHACSDEYLSDPSRMLREYDACVAAAETQALADVRAIRQSQAASATFASLAPTSRGR